MTLALWLFVARALAFPEEADVLVLEDSSFDQAVEEYPYLLVQLYAPWSGDCQKLAPENAKAAAVLKAQTPALHIAQVDATVNTGLAGRFDTASFPTLKFFQKGQARDYDGGLSAEEIVAWVNDAVQRRVKVVNTAEELKSSIAQLGLTVVFFAKADSDEAHMAEQTASQTKASNILLVPSLEVAQAYSLAQPSLLLFNHKEDTQVQFTDKWTTTKIAEFIKNSKSALVMTDVQAALEYAIHKRSPVLYVFRNETDIEGLFDMLANVANAENQEIRFCYGALTDEKMSNIVSFFGLYSEDKPLAMLFDMRGTTTRKFKYTERSLSEESLSAFIGKWRRGLLTPFYKSEKDGERQGPVMHITSDNYDQMVSKYSKKGLLVFYFTDWCVRCQDIDLGHVYHDLEGDKVRIGKIDVMKNELPWMDIPVYPAVYWYHKSKSPLIYSGDFKTESIIEWVKETCLKGDATKKEKEGKKTEL